MGETYLLLPEINLLIQSLILVVFFLSLVFKMKGKFVIHGTLMMVTVISAIAVFLLLSPGIMSEKASDFTNYLQLFFDSPVNFVLFVLHISFTVSAVLLGVWVVGSWRFRSELFCAPKKTVMKLILILWILGYLVGVLFYLVINTNIIT